MPYIAVLQQKVIHYCNAGTFVMRYSQDRLLAHLDL